MVIKPIDLQVVIAQQTTVAGSEQATQNAASNVQAQTLHKIPEKTHEREMQIEKSGEATDSEMKVDEKESGPKEQGKRKRKEAKAKRDQKPADEPHIKEEGKGAKFDALS